MFHLERPTMPETTALGAAMAAGAAKGIEVWPVNPEDKSLINTDVFNPSMDAKGRQKQALIVSNAGRLQDLMFM